MANTFRTGIYPARLDGLEYRIFPITSSNGTNVFVGDCVSFITGSGATSGSVAPSAAGDNAIVAGTVVALYDNQQSLGQGVQSNGVPIGMWASTVSSKYLPASTAGWALVALAKPGVLFLAVTNTIMTTAVIGKSTALVATAGNTVTAQSGHVINGGDTNTGNQFIIIGPKNVPDNDITAASAQWYVMFNESLFMGVGKATGV